MKIKKFNNLFVFNSDEENLIKEILIEIKDEFPYVVGQLREETDKSGVGGFYVITLHTKYEMVDNGSKSQTMSQCKSTLKFLNLVISCSERLQDVLKREVRIIGLLEEDIEIWIDTPNRTKST